MVGDTCVIWVCAVPKNYCVMGTKKVVEITRNVYIVMYISGSGLIGLTGTHNAAESCCGRGGHGLEHLPAPKCFAFLLVKEMRK